MDKKFYIILVIFVVTVAGFGFSQWQQERQEADQQENTVFADFSIDAADAIVITSPSQTIELTKNGDWKVGEEDADDALVEAALEDLYSARVRSLVARSPEEAISFESEAEPTIEVLVEGGGQSLVHVYIGTSSPATRSTYARHADEQDVYLTTMNRALYELDSWVAQNEEEENIINNEEAEQL